MDKCEWVEVTNTNTGVKKYRTSCKRFEQIYSPLPVKSENIGYYCLCGKEIEIQED